MLQRENEYLKAFHACIFHRPEVAVLPGPYQVGIDLGTSSIVIAVVDEKRTPVFGAFEYNEAIKDGLVVNFLDSVAIVKQLKAEAEEYLASELVYAAGAVPPGTIGRNRDIVGNVLESAGFEVSAIVDEPTAAAVALNIRDGIVVDVGGGTTGVSVLKQGKVVYVSDEPTGGHHMNLVVSGYYQIPIKEAEMVKRDYQREKEIFAIIRPVVEKMATITARALNEVPETDTLPLYIVGGACNFTEFEETFAKYIPGNIYKPIYPEYVTPIGIALSSTSEERREGAR